MSRQQSICIYSPWMMSVGGIETHLLNISKALARRGWKVDLCVKYSSMTMPAIQALRRAGVGYHRFPSVGFFKNALLSRSLLYTNSQGNTSPLIWRASRGKRRGFHHCHTTCMADERGSWTPLYTAFIQQGPPLVACSRQTMRNLRELAGPNRIEVLPYLTGSDEELKDSAATETLTDTRSKLSFGFIGRMEQSKGIDLIIAASKRADLAGICWHLHGDGHRAAEVKEWQGPNLQWHGPFDRNKPLANIYAPLDAVVLPSLHVEGSPLCLIEAMSFGKPWIASYRGGIPELACSAEDNLIVDPQHPEQFFAAVKQLESRIRQGAVSSSKIQEFFRSEFSPGAVMAKWDNYLGRLESSG